MFNHSVRNWIPDKLNDRQTVQQFADAVDWMLSVDFPNSDKLASRFNSVKNKYRSLNDVPLEDVYAILEENGYKYITDTLALDENSLRTFLAFLNFIHMYKGTRKGLEFVFRLLQMEYNITEWFEMSPVGEPLTFNVDLLSFSPNNARGFEVADRIIAFARSYVYPVLKHLLIEFKLDTASLNFLNVFQSTGDITLYPDSLYLIWGVNNWSEKLWGPELSSFLRWDIGQWDVNLME